MTRIVVTQKITAPIGVVFNAFADIRQIPIVLPHVITQEFLSDIKSGIGTRFRETRLMNGKESITELEVTEYVENDHVRMVADSHGTVWDTIVCMNQEKERVALTITMDAKAYKLLPKLMYPFIKGMIKKAMVKDLDLVKSYCEKSG